MNYDKTDMNYRSYKGYNLVRVDPFGFWVIRDQNDKQIMPEMYTMVSMARQAVDSIDNRVQKKRKG